MIDAPHGSGTGSTQLIELLDAGIAELSRATDAWCDEARAAARGARALAAFARHRPQGAFDRQPGERGAMSAAAREARPDVLTEVSEWAVDEVAIALRLSGPAASDRLVDSLVLVERLPATLALLDEGLISWAHVRQMIAQVGPVADADLRARIEARVLGLLRQKTPSQLGDCARRIVLREDADAAARRLVEAVRSRGVRLIDRRDGSATVVLDLPLPVAAAIHRALEAHADSVRTEGDERTKQQRMADVVADLILRTGQDGLPAVTVALTLVATLETMLGGAEPGQVEGHLVPAEMVRELAYTFGLMPRPAPDLAGVPDGDDAGDARSAPPPCEEPAETESEQEPKPLAPTPGSGTEPVPTRAAAEDTPTPTPVRDRSLAEWMAQAAARHDAAVAAALGGARRAVLDGTWTDGEERALLDLGALIGVRDVAGTGLVHRPHIAVVDRLRGSLVALTDAAGLRGGEPLGPPAATDAHDPIAGLERFVRLRDRRCRFPGCRARARVCDLDHQRPWPHGRTEVCNLCCLCEHHHRLKHQAPGWRFEAADDGTLTVTTPAGETRVSHPPRFGTDLDIPPF
ncbi:MULTISPECIES: DUF222 domain-containing protein [unclassified Blastococcus]